MAKGKTGGAAMASSKERADQEHDQKQSSAQKISVRIDSVIDDPAYFTAVQIQAIAAGLEEKISAIADSHENVTAQTLKITDSGNWFSGESVEDALQEIGGTLAGVDNLLKEI